MDAHLVSEEKFGFQHRQNGRKNRITEASNTLIHGDALGYCDWVFPLALGNNCRELPSIRADD
jgi:hypothetical protein